jgi:hypothetical protein
VKRPAGSNAAVRIGFLRQICLLDATNPVGAI